MWRGENERPEEDCYLLWYSIDADEFTEQEWEAKREAKTGISTIAKNMCVIGWTKMGSNMNPKTESGPTFSQAMSCHLKFLRDYLRKAVTKHSNCAMFVLQISNQYFVENKPNELFNLHQFYSLFIRTFRDKRKFLHPVIPTSFQV